MVVNKALETVMNRGPGVISKLEEKMETVTSAGCPE